MKFKVKLELTTNLLGTVTKNQEVYDTYIKTRAKGKETRDEFCSPLADDEMKEKEAKGWTGFMMEEGKPFVMDYYIRGFLKNAGNVIKKDLDLKNLKSKIDNFVFVFPRKIFLDKNIMDQPYERPLRAMTMQGPRVTLAKSDQIEAGAKLEFILDIPYECEIKEKHLRAMLDYGQYQGLGQFRNGGFGRFKYTLESMDKKKKKVSEKLSEEE